MQMPKTEMLCVVKQQWITNIPNPFCCMAGGNCVGGTDHSSGRDLSPQSSVIHCQDSATVFHQRFCFLRIALKCFCSRTVSWCLNAGDQPHAHYFCWPKVWGAGGARMRHKSEFPGRRMGMGFTSAGSAATPVTLGSHFCYQQETLTLQVSFSLFLYFFFTLTT